MILAGHNSKVKQQQ